MKRIRQAGAIAVRPGRTPRVLLVQAKRDPNRWIFPKGHIERGETAAGAALRELREEAGVEGTLAGKAGKLTFRSGREKVQIRYFVVCAEKIGEPQEGRARRWCELEEALRLLWSRKARKLLTDAWPAIEGAATPSGGADPDQ